MYKLSEYLLIIDYNKVNFINKYNFKLFSNKKKIMKIIKYEARRSHYL